MGWRMDATKIGAVWLLIHIDKNKPKNIIAKRNREGEWPSFFCNQAATRSSNWHLHRAEDRVYPPKSNICKAHMTG
jgi:hypothetical protein